MTWLKTAQAAAHLQISPSTLVRYANAGQIPHRRVGRSLRFIREELDEWPGTEKGVTTAAPEDDWAAQVRGIRYQRPA